MKRFRWDKKYLYWGITAFCVIAAAIAFYLLLNHLGGLREALHKLMRILSPFIWGLVIAYLLYPLQRIYQQYLFTPLAKALYKKSAKAESAVPKLARGLSVFLAEISLLVILAGLVWLVAPQLYSSVERIVVNSQTYVETVDRWISKVLTNSPELEAAVTTAVGDISDGLVNLATVHLLPKMGSVITNVTSGVYSIARGIYNMIIGIIVSIYVLWSRTQFAAHTKKILYSVFSLQVAKKILDAVHFTNDVFMGFISGKLLDSIIIALLCYAGCLIMKIPYGMLCSFIVGVTNIIPFFGPIFGLIPTTLIILMVDPIKAVIFLGFGILLQQFDGNILGPKILGNSVGIGGFWVLFAIIVGSGLFGFPGMLLGVPVFVVLYTFFKNLVNRKLDRSGLPVDTKEFVDLDHIDPETGEKVTFAPADRRRRKKRKKPKAAPHGAASGRMASGTDPATEDARATEGRETAAAEQTAGENAQR